MQKTKSPCRSSKGGGGSGTTNKGLKISIKDNNNKKEKIDCDTSSNTKAEGQQCCCAATESHTISDFMPKSASVLVIGATGRTGLECLRRFLRHENKPEVHAFVRDASKLSNFDAKKCKSIVEGDATDEKDIAHALKRTQALNIIVCIGGNESPTIRTDSATAIVKVLKKRKYRKVKVLVLSRNENSISNPLTKRKLRGVFNDHIGQEQAFKDIIDRVTIVRPTPIKDKIALGQVEVLGFSDDFNNNNVKNKGMFAVTHTPRADLVSWIVQETCNGKPLGGRIVNITGVKR